jgi:hypothetical protein
MQSPPGYAQIKLLPPAWLVAPATDEIFEGKEDLSAALTRLGFVRGLRGRSRKGLEEWNSSLGVQM